jgi:hypothetical protein
MRAPGAAVGALLTSIPILPAARQAQPDVESNGKERDTNVGRREFLLTAGFVAAAGAARRTGAQGITFQG